MHEIPASAGSLVEPVAGSMMDGKKARSFGSPKATTAKSVTVKNHSFLFLIVSQLKTDRFFRLR